MGGRATYTYGLETHEHFAGFLVIGAFLNGIGQVGEARLVNATDKPFYIMHGDQDNTAPINTAFFPIRNELINRGAIVQSMILTGVDHTIDFPNRDQILTTAYNWLNAASDDLAVSLEDHSGQIPEKAQLAQNYPNPFNPETEIRYQLSKRENVKLTIYNQLGQRVRTLVNGGQAPGNYVQKWDGKDFLGREVASGLYIYRFETEASTQTRKMLLLR